MDYFGKFEILESPTRDPSDLREARSLHAAEKVTWKRWGEIEKQFWNNGYKLWRPGVRQLRPFSQSNFYKYKWQLKTAIFEINLNSYEKCQTEIVYIGVGDRRKKYQRSGIESWREIEQELLIKYMINLLEKSESNRKIIFLEKELRKRDENMDRLKRQVGRLRVQTNKLKGQIDRLKQIDLGIEEKKRKDMLQ